MFPLAGVSRACQNAHQTKLGVQKANDIRPVFRQPILLRTRRSGVNDNVRVCDRGIRKKGAGSGEILRPKPQIQCNVLALHSQRPKQIGIVIGRMALTD